MLKKLLKIGLIFSFLLVLPVSALAFDYQLDCLDEETCSTCPEGVVNSHYISDNCSGTYPGCTGLCDFECDAGYEWDEGMASCMEIPYEPTLIFTSTDTTSLLTFVGEVFSDFKLLVILIIGLPLGFWLIRKVISLIKFKEEKK